MRQENILKITHKLTSVNELNVDFICMYSVHVFILFWSILNIGVLSLNEHAIIDCISCCIDNFYVYYSGQYAIKIMGVSNK